jgi:hypothetical protein
LVVGGPVALGTVNLESGIIGLEGLELASSDARMDPLGIENNLSALGIVLAV